MELFVPVVVIIAIGVIVLSMWQSQKRREQWQQFARSNGLDYSAGGWLSTPEMSGVVDGISVRIAIEMRGGKNKRPFTRVTARIPGALPSSMTIGAEKFFQRIGKAFGAQDIELGDPDLDSKLMIKGSNPVAVRRYLEKPRIVRTALALVTRNDEGSIRDGAVVLVESGFLLGGSLDVLLDRALQAARALSPEGAPLSPSRQIAPTVPEPEPPAAAPEPEPPPAAPEPEPPPAVPDPVPAPATQTATPDPELMADLARLADPFVLSTESDQIIEKWMGTEVSLELELKRIDRPFSFGAADDQPGAPTLIGQAEGLDVQVRMAHTGNDETKAMQPGETVRVCGTVAEYDSLFRRLVLEGT